MFTFVTPLDSRNALAQLVHNVLFGQPPGRTEATIVTKRTTANGYRAVNVGASETSVKADPLDTVSILLLQKETIWEISVSGSPPVDIVAT